MAAPGMGGDPMKFKPGLILEQPLSVGAVPQGDLSIPVPAHLDVRDQLLPTSDQGSTSLCASYSVAGAVEYWQWKLNGVVKQVDPQPIHNEAKKNDGFPDDEATTIEAALRAVAKLGFLPIRTETIRMVRTVQEVKQALHRYGVVPAGFTASTNWQHASSSGWIKSGGEYLGGHAVLLCGYSDVENPRWWAAQNSWGDSQGWRGFVRMTPDVFLEQFRYGYVFDLQ